MKHTLLIAFLFLMAWGTQAQSQVSTGGGVTATLEARSKTQIGELYPNPASREVTLEYALAPTVKEARIVFFNILGSAVQTQVLNKNERTAQADISGLAPGVYIYSIEVDGNSLLSRRLIIKR